MSSLTVERVAELVDEMAPAQAADILSALPDSDTNAILDKVDPTEAVKIRSLIERHDERILDMSTTHYITFPPSTTRRAPQSDERRLSGIPDENFPASPISLTKAVAQRRGQKKGPMTFNGFVRATAGRLRWAQQAQT